FAEHVRHAVNVAATPDVEQAVKRDCLVVDGVAPTACPLRLDSAEQNGRCGSRLRQPAREQEIAAGIPLEALAVNRAVWLAYPGVRFRVAERAVAGWCW